MDFFDGKRMRIGDTEKNLLARIIREATHAFSSRLNDPNLKYLDKKETPDAFACEQIIKLSLELMLIEMIRKALQGQGSSRLSTSVRENSDQEVLQKILAFLQENVRGKISLDDVCAHTLFSRSYIQRMFKHQTGSSIMDYYKRLKIEEAKLMIREGKYNFTQISELLSYASIHHFSRHFKEITGHDPFGIRFLRQGKDLNRHAHTFTGYSSICVFRGNGTVWAALPCFFAPAVALCFS